MPKQRPHKAAQLEFFDTGRGWRRCPRCGKKKRLIKFRLTRPTYRDRVCAKCRDAASREREGEHYNIRRNAINFMRRFGLTERETEALRMECSAGECALCDLTGTCFDVGGTLHIDHDPETGLIRGAVCRRHNYSMEVLLSLRPAPRCVKIYLDRAFSRGWYVEELKGRWHKTSRHRWLLTRGEELVGPDGLPVLLGPKKRGPEILLTTEKDIRETA